jgi:sialate O-acetylesterase
MNAVGSESATEMRTPELGRNRKGMCLGFLRVDVPLRALLIFLSVFGLALHAEVTLPAIFSNHMVLQRGVTLPVWGWAAPGEHVIVTVAERCAETIADSRGSWRVTLRPLEKSTETTTLVINAGNRLEITDVIIGDVWICAGEGNMDFPLSSATTGRGGDDMLRDRDLRFFIADKKSSVSPEQGGSGRWIVCSPEAVSRLSAVGYFFARDIRSSQHIPVGMIQCTSENTPAQAWISRRGLETPPSIRPHRSDGKTHEADAKVDAGSPSSIFNGMIAPLIPYAITGAIWYQGETQEEDDAIQYRRLLPRLIKDWRARWGQGPFPFYFVMLAGFGGDQDAIVESYRGHDGKPLHACPWLREGQKSALMLPNTGMALATDLGDPETRLPEDKLDVGRRLALLARHRVYGEEVIDSGPVLKGMSIDGRKARLRFGSVGGGLVLGIPPWHPEGESVPFLPSLRGFAIRGEDGKWHRADAVIDGDSVILSSSSVRSPEAVRYGWKGTPDGNLYNREGLPAVPFRTDSDQP